MLTFDAARDRLMLGDVAIGRGTRPGDVAGRVPGRVEDVRGHPGRRRFDGRSGDLHVTLYFADGVLESGHIVAAGPEGPSWESFDADEAWRRQRHAALVRSLFGALHHASPDLVVDLVRDPHHGSEQVRIVIP